MSWTPEQRRQYAPALSATVRANAMVRLATTIDIIDPPARTGRPRLWSTLTMLQALWWLCRAGAAWMLLPATCPPRQTIGSRLDRWRRLGVLERALAVLNGCLRLARGRKRRPSAGILDTQSVRTGPQAGPRGYDAGKKVKGRKRVLLVCRRLGPCRPGGAGLGAGPRHAGLDRAGACGKRLAQGLGRPRLRRRACHGPAGPPRHRARAGRAQEQDRLRGRATALEDRADLRLPSALPPLGGRSRRQHRHVSHHDLAGRAVHDRCPIRKTDHGMTVFGTALTLLCQVPASFEPSQRLGGADYLDLSH